MTASKDSVVYLYDSEVSNFHYGPRHPMKPYRIALTHALVGSLGLHKHMKVITAPQIALNEMKSFHTEEYLNLLNEPEKYEWTKGYPWSSSSSLSSEDGDSVVKEFKQVADAQCGEARSVEPCETRNDRLRSARCASMRPKLNRQSHVSSTSDDFSDGTSEWARPPTLPPTADPVLSPTTVRTFNNNADCPLFHGVYDFCSRYTSASLTGARLLNSKKFLYAINWSGGLHHARKSEASGFCFVNDIVIAIQALLEHHRRVLYIDIDVHHGDGVEEAFYLTDRVMTLSFHQYDGEFFPRTGSMYDIGDGKGKMYSVNVPLQQGVSDQTYRSVFRPIVEQAVFYYMPEAIVLQCGADSLAGDRLGRFNMSIKEHAECVKYVLSFKIPVLVLGGGGYTVQNVSRCWAYETACVLGEEANLPSEVPDNDYVQYFRPDYKLLPNLCSSRVQDLNSPRYLQAIRQFVGENLRSLPHVPSLQITSVGKENTEQ